MRRLARPLVGRRLQPRAGARPRLPRCPAGLCRRRRGRPQAEKAARPVLLANRPPDQAVDVRARSRLRASPARDQAMRPGTARMPHHATADRRGDRIGPHRVRGPGPERQGRPRSRARPPATPAAGWQDTRQSSSRRASTRFREPVRARRRRRGPAHPVGRGAARPATSGPFRPLGRETHCNGYAARSARRSARLSAGARRPGQPRRTRSPQPVTSWSTSRGGTRRGAEPVLVAAHQDVGAAVDQNNGVEAQLRDQIPVRVSQRLRRTPSRAGRGLPASGRARPRGSTSPGWPSPG